MEHDLFSGEQQIYDSSLKHITEIRGNGASVNADEYAMIVNEYGKLLKQLRRATRIADRTTSSLHTSNMDLNDKVNYDALTGIFNRRYMEQKLKSIMSFMSRGEGGELSVMMVDVDNFKKYNDTYGHGMGDACLKSIAQALAAGITRNEDFAARYGGEEFAVVLPNTDEAGARKIASKILISVKDLNIPHEKNEAGVVTVSIGVTTGHISHHHNGSDYINHADKALYMSKEGGRDRYTHISFIKEESV